MKFMAPILTALALLTAGSDSEAAFADLRTLPAQVQPYIAYLTVAAVAPEHHDQLAKQIKFVAASLSSKPYLGDQLPYAVPQTNLLRLDLQALGWDKTWAKVIQEQYVPAWRPDLVHTKQVPLVVNGLWFVAALTDSNITGDGQYQLLYQGKPPKNLAEFEKFWGVNGDPFVAFARIEERSGVSVEGRRVIQNKPVNNRGHYWLTLDSAVVAGVKDQLQNIAEKNLKHDASEAIAGNPKYINGKGGNLQVYFLANGEGKRQEKAPTNIVKDDTLTRGVEILNTVSCVGCHVEGLRHPTLDGYRSYIESGARIYAYDKATQEEIDRYFQSPIAKEIERNNADYAEALALVNGLTPADNAAQFRAMVRLYDAPLGLEQQARELYAAPAEWRLALGNYSRTYQLSARLAAAAQGQEISRNQWQNDFGLAQKVIGLWQQN